MLMLMSKCEPALRDALLSRSRTVGKRKSLMRHKLNKAVQTSIALTELTTEFEADGGRLSETGPA